MIRSLRRRHVRTAVALAVLIPAILLAALAGRRETPTQPIPAELLGPSATPSPP